MRGLPGDIHIDSASRLLFNAAQTEMPRILNRIVSVEQGKGKKYDYTKLKTKLRGLSPRANYTIRATADCRPSLLQILRREGVTWSV
jgi:hypothetical protein